MSRRNRAVANSLKRPRRSPWTRAFRTSNHQRVGAAAPTLWWFEVRNALVQGERRGRFSEFATARFLRDISRLAITIDRAPSEQGVLTLARRHRLTVYDASYLELAQREALPLATLDKELATAAGAEQVPLIGADIR